MGAHTIFFGAVAVVCGDNASMHHLGGFNKCFSSGKVCRFCTADYSHLNRISDENACVLRTAETQEVQLRLVEQDPRLTSVYGVVERSPLVELPDFLIPYGLPPDIMHDALERVLCLNVKVVLQGLNKVGSNKQRALSYSKVQQIHGSFKYSSLDKINQAPVLPPTLMEKKTPLCGSASQKWHLFHFLSLILGPHVPQDNVYWKLHLILNRICDIVFAITVTEDMLWELENLVKEHHTAWITLVRGVYPPKLHYFVHYARLMLIYGNLRGMWCMRYEAFRQYIKRLMQKLNNFIWISKTVTTRVQMKRCLLHSGDDALPPLVNVTVAQKNVTVESLSCDVKECLLNVRPDLNAFSVIGEVSQVTVGSLSNKII